MSTSHAELFARRARDATDVAAVGENVKRAIDELVKEIKQLNVRVAGLEADMRRC
jgi:hypothetical protein